jgi:hypothetical protein
MQLRLLFTFLLCLLLSYTAVAKGARKSFLVTYPKDVPPSVLDAAKQKIIKKGGKITHTYGKQPADCCLFLLDANAFQISSTASQPRYPRRLLAKSRRWAKNTTRL